MGGITALLLIAASGINYGWKPDETGGVEYLIQIPPDQLAELRRVGSISSTIDPAVRGHVSRVVLQLGEGPLPRILPPGLEGQGSASGAARVASSDATSIPIPEIMAASGGIQTINQAVMKPQTGDPNGGVGLSLPPSLGVGPPPIDTNTGGNARNVVPPPATRSPSIGLPPFTGANPNATNPNATNFGAANTSTGSGLAPGMAGARPGGPSTAPTTDRDRDWMTINPTGSGGPSTDPVMGGTGSLPNRTTNGMGVGATAIQPGVNGLGSSDTFGRPPAGVANGASAANPNLRNPSFGTGAYGQSSMTNPTATAQTDVSNPFARDRNLSNPVANTMATPDRSRLTPAQIAAGAWRLDAYGNPVDRNGMKINMNPNLGRGAATTGDWRANPAVQGTVQPGTVQPGTGYADGGLRTQSPQFARQSSPFNQASNSTNPQVNNAGTFRDREDSARSYPNRYQPTDRDAETRPVGGEGALAGGKVIDSPAIDSPSSRRETLTRPQARQATQPLITWLLLISFVSNVYLIFWMKKLLVRYRDLVAAKRVSDSRAAA